MRPYIIISAMILMLVIISSSGLSASESNSAIDYFEFINLFNPGSPDFTIAISYHPGGTVNISPAKLKNITVNIVRINSTRNVDFYIRFIVTRNFWVPYKTPYSDESSFWHKLKMYNQWLNKTTPLTHNIYEINPERVHFTSNMTNLTVKLKLRIYGWGNDWGVTILGKPHNGTMWIPIGGVPIKINHDGMERAWPWVSSLSIISVSIFTTIAVKKRIWKKSK